MVETTTDTEALLSRYVRDAQTYIARNDFERVCAINDAAFYDRRLTDRDWETLDGVIAMAIRLGYLTIF